jgi:hypothetical protein
MITQRDLEMCQLDCEYKVALAEKRANKAEAELTALGKDARDIGKILEDNGCDCECDCDSDGHWSDCEMCLPCRIGVIVNRILATTEADK